MSAPKVPKLNASKEEYRRFAREVEDYEPYKREPPGGVQTDPVPESEGPPTEEDDDGKA